MAVPESPQALLARVRTPEPSPAPPWVNAIPDRIGDILESKHLCKDGPVWGLARQYPEGEIPFDEVGTATFLNLRRQYNLEGRFPFGEEDVRQKALEYWQSWQDSDTGRFIDPRDPERGVNEKYVVSVIHSLGGELLYPWTTTSAGTELDTQIFLARTKEDPDWADGGWGVGSHTGYMAIEIFRAIEDGRTELIPDLETGIQQILSHQDSVSGMWGSPTGELWRRLGGNLKVIGRLYFGCGMFLPHSRELADTLIERQQDGTWFEQGADSCVPRNLAEMIAYCLEISEYRHDELLDTMQSLADDYTHWVTPDGYTLMKRDDPESTGIQYTTIYGLGIVGAYLNWEDCRLPNPLANSRRGNGYRHGIRVKEDGKVELYEKS